MYAPLGVAYWQKGPRFPERVRLTYVYPLYKCLRCDQKTDRIVSMWYCDRCWLARCCR